MWKYLQEEGIIKIMLAEINFDKYKENTNKESPYNGFSSLKSPVIP